MERRNAPHPLLFWSATIGSLALLIVALLLFGSSLHPTLDSAGYVLRRILGLPLTTTDLKLFPTSPKGTWRVKVVNRSWRHYSATVKHTDELVAERSGRPFLKGERLDVIPFAHEYQRKEATWLTDSILALHDRAAIGGTTFTLVNDTARTLPCVQVICNTSDSYSCFFFDVPAHSTHAVLARGPAPGGGVYCALAPGSPTGQAVRPSPGPSSVTLTGVRITIRDAGLPEIEFTTTTASTAGAP